MLKIASWNVNSIKIRLEQTLDWLVKSNTDVLALQETKTIDELFPIEQFTNLGFYVAFAGQKSYNGVAIISKAPITEVITDIPSLDDPQRRILAVTIENLRLINLYVPNGREVGCDKYYYKLDWLNKVGDFVSDELKSYKELAVVGDFNIAPEDCDVYDANIWKDRILVSQPERQSFADLMSLGLHDSIRHHNPGQAIYSWWDYRAASFRRNLGLRIDHILLSEALHMRSTGAHVDIEPRKAERPSDHAPVWTTIKRW